MKKLFLILGIMVFGTIIHATPLEEAVAALNRAMSSTQRTSTDPTDQIKLNHLFLIAENLMYYCDSSRIALLEKHGLLEPAYKYLMHLYHKINYDSASYEMLIGSCRSVLSELENLKIFVSCDTEKKSPPSLNKLSNWHDGITGEGNEELIIFLNHILSVYRPFSDPDLIAITHAEALSLIPPENESRHSTDNEFIRAARRAICEPPSLPPQTTYPPSNPELLPAGAVEAGSASPETDPAPTAIPAGGATAQPKPPTDSLHTPLPASSAINHSGRLITCFPSPFSLRGSTPGHPAAGACGATAPVGTRKPARRAIDVDAEEKKLEQKRQDVVEAKLLIQEVFGITELILEQRDFHFFVCKIKDNNIFVAREGGINQALNFAKRTTAEQKFIIWIDPIIDNHFTSHLATAKTHNINIILMVRDKAYALSIYSECSKIEGATAFISISTRKEMVFPSRTLDEHLPLTAAHNETPAGGATAQAEPVAREPLTPRMQVPPLPTGAFASTAPVPRRPPAVGTFRGPDIAQSKVLIKDEFGIPNPKLTEVRKNVFQCSDKDNTSQGNSIFLARGRDIAGAIAVAETITSTDKKILIWSSPEYNLGEYIAEARAANIHIIVMVKDESSVAKLLNDCNRLKVSIAVNGVMLLRSSSLYELPSTPEAAANPFRVGAISAWPTPQHFSMPLRASSSVRGALPAITERRAAAPASKPAEIPDWFGTAKSLIQKTLYPKNFSFKNCGAGLWRCEDLDDEFLVNNILVTNEAGIKLALQIANTELSGLPESEPFFIVYISSTNTDFLTTLAPAVANNINIILMVPNKTAENKADKQLSGRLLADITSVAILNTIVKETDALKKYCAIQQGTLRESGTLTCGGAGSGAGTYAVPSRS